MANSKRKLEGADRTWGFAFGVDGVVSIREACRLMSIGRSTLYQLFEQEKLRRGNIGRKVVVCRRSIDEHLKLAEV